MIIADAQQSLTASEAGDLTHLVLRKIELVLNEPRLLLLHLHDELDAAGVQYALAVAAALQAKEVLHSLRARDGDAAKPADGLYHFQNEARRLRIGRCAHKAPQLVREQSGKAALAVHNEIVGNAGCPKGAVCDHVVRHAGEIEDNVLVIEVNVVSARHCRSGAGDVAGEDDR